ncbi:MAG TPA: porin family protein [Cryomorphaceae bacterium]|nr:porin family protein [Cryomorphaceae bacterium]
MKNLSLLTFAILLTTATFGQHLGIKGGLNISNLSIDDGDVDNRFAYHFGGYFNLPVGELLSIQPELLYSARGASSTYDADVLGFDIEGESTFNLNYIDVPVLAVFHLGDALQIEAGPYVSFLANSSFETDGDLGDFDADIDNDSFKSLDYGLTGGLGVNLGLLQVGARYMYGLQEIQDSEGAEILLGDAKNRVIQVYAALRIGNYD